MINTLKQYNEFKKLGFSEKQSIALTEIIANSSKTIDTLKTYNKLLESGFTDKKSIALTEVIAKNNEL